MGSSVCFRCAICVLMLYILASFASWAADTLDLRKAVIVTYDENRVVKTAARMLVEEIAKRTDITLPCAAEKPGDIVPVILLGRVDKLPADLQDFVTSLNVPEKAEGFAIGVPYELTWSCYRGLKYPCGKCDSCVIRKRGFDEAGEKDPLISRRNK